MSKRKTIKYSFGAGELSPRLLMRPDLEKFSLGAKRMRNFFVDSLGGASTRHGTEFVDYIYDKGYPSRIVPFTFNEETQNNYVIVFAKDKIYFVQDGGYVLEASVSATISGNIITSPAHGLQEYDLVVSAGGLFWVHVINANSFSINRIGDGPNPGAGAVTYSKVYSVFNPYGPSDFTTLQFSQDRDALYIMHPNYEPRKLVRNDHTNWQIDKIGVRPQSVLELGGFPTITASSSGTAGVAYCITCVGADGIEHPPGENSYWIQENIVNMTTTAGSYKVEWGDVPDAVRYRVYRTRVNFKGADTNLGQPFGFVGEVDSPVFIDENIVPDFSRQPASVVEPFKPGVVSHIDVLTKGSGYNRQGLGFTISDTSSSWYPATLRGVVNSAGEVLGMKVLGGGYGHQNPTVNHAGPGSGATFDVKIGPKDGTYPACSTGYQQRRLYAGTINAPSVVYGSSIGFPDYFIYTNDAGTDADPFTLRLQNNSTSVIRFMQETTAGIFAFSARGVVQLAGKDFGEITGNSAQARSQTDVGCAQLEPLKIGRAHLYLTTSSNAVMALQPSNLPQYFTTADISILSDHLFREEKNVIAWTWVEDPHKLIWAVRSDGSLLSCTYVPEQNVIAWAHHTTKGHFKDVCSVFEGGHTVPYYIVSRVISGASYTMIERMKRRYVSTEEQMWAVDCGLQLLTEEPKATLQPLAGSNTIKVILEGGDPYPFGPGDIGKSLRFGDAKVKITNIGPPNLTVTYLRPLTKEADEFDDYPLFLPGQWMMSAEVTEVTGLWHLNGATIDILADGKVHQGLTVLQGKITLPQAASYVIAGLPYTGELESLPLTLNGEIIEGKQKRIVGGLVRLWNSRECLIGVGEDTYDLKDRQTLADDVFITGLVEATVRAPTGNSWDETLRFEKNKPVHTTILGYVMDFEIDTF